MNKPQLFARVKCRAFLKKEHDGRCISIQDGRCWYEPREPDTPECECEGALEFLKTYFVRKERDFSGVVIGTKDVVTKAYLVA